jgi:hypothetical protein
MYLILFFIRYLAVCHPHARVMTRRRAWTVTVVSLVCCMFSVTPSGLMSGHYVTDHHGNLCYSGVCHEDGSDTSLIPMSGHTAYSIFLSCVFVTCVAVISCFYVVIFVSVYRRFKKQRLKNQVIPAATSNASNIFKTKAQKLTPAAPSIAATINEEETANSAACDGGDVEKQNNDNKHHLAATSRTRNGSKVERSSVSGGSRSGHMRTAKMLLLVTLVFILSWLPFFLIKLHIVPNIVSVRLTFFLSNMINPLIYSFTNSTFSEYAWKLLNCKSFTPR